jgi:uncharacterized protein YeaO (DUF488 family)
VHMHYNRCCTHSHLPAHTPRHCCRSTLQEITTAHESHARAAQAVGAEKELVPSRVIDKQNRVAQAAAQAAHEAQQEALRHNAHHNPALYNQAQQQHRQNLHRQQQQQLQQQQQQQARHQQHGISSTGALPRAQQLPAGGCCLLCTVL